MCALGIIGLLLLFSALSNRGSDTLTGNFLHTLLWGKRSEIVHKTRPILDFNSLVCIDLEGGGRES